MKATSSLLLFITFCATAASAFGLHGASVSKAIKHAGVQGLNSNNNKPMVQAIDVQGQRLPSLVSFTNACKYVHNCIDKTKTRDATKCVQNSFRLCCLHITKAPKRHQKDNKKGSNVPDHMMSPFLPRHLKFELLIIFLLIF